MLGEMKMSASDLFKAGLASAAANLFLVGIPCYLYCRFLQRSLWKGVGITALAMIASLPCVAVVPIFFFMRSVKGQMNLVDDIRVTLENLPDRQDRSNPDGISQRTLG